MYFFQKLTKKIIFTLEMTRKNLRITESEMGQIMWKNVL